MDILYFNNDWNADNRTSSHHIARELARHHRVVYFECPGLRTPRATGRDLRRSVTMIRTALARPRPIANHMTVSTLLQIPLHGRPGLKRLNSAVMLGQVRRTMRHLRVRRPLAWFGQPHLTPLLGRMGEILDVYYCIDDFAALPGVDPPAVRAMDEEMTRRAHVVFVASRPMLDRKRGQAARLHLNPHGVDHAHFARSLDAATPIAAEVAALPRPVVGYIGLVERWLDLDLLGAIAAARPQWSFVLVGRLAVEPNGVDRLPNVHLLGPRPYERLPEYARGFDVALMPYLLNDQVLHSNPIKLREYLAAGRPVVSVPVPEVERFAEVVHLARGPEGFLRAIEDALGERDPAAARRRSEYVRPMSWEACVHRAMEIVEATLAERNAAAAEELAGSRQLAAGRKPTK